MSEKQIIVPTVGRKVWVRLNGALNVLRGTSPGFIHNVGYEPLDASITAVWGNRMINVAGFDAMGSTFAMNSVTLVQPGDPLPPAGSAYVEWMPYQVKTAEDGK